MLLDPKKAVKLLKKYKIPVYSYDVATSVHECVRYAKNKLPVVLKVVSKDIVHKIDTGGVIANVKTEMQVKKAYHEILKNVKKKAPKAYIEGIAVQKFTVGTEVFIGMKKDPQFGTVIAFGLGGVYVEVLKDVSFRISPLRKRDAIEMIQEIKSYKILRGARSQKKANINALVDIILKLDKMVQENKEIVELDFNPIMVNDKEAVVVDPRIII